MINISNDSCIHLWEDFEQSPNTAGLVGKMSKELHHNIRENLYLDIYAPEILSDDLRCNIHDDLFLDAYRELDDFNFLIFFLLPTL